MLGYTHLTPEAPYEIEENKPAPSWPQEGTITFKNYSTKYRPELNPSLRDINLHIKGGDTVGVSKAWRPNREPDEAKRDATLIDLRAYGRREE